MCICKIVMGLKAVAGSMSRDLERFCVILLGSGAEIYKKNKKIKIGKHGEDAIGTFVGGSWGMSM